MANDFLSFALAYNQAHPGVDSSEMISAWNDLEFSQQLKDAQKIDVGSTWDSINQTKDWMGAVGDLSWNQLSAGDQAELSNIIAANPDILFQDVSGHSMLLPDKVSIRSIGDGGAETKEATPFSTRSSAYFGNYYAPTQTDMLYRLAPDIAAKYGITGDSIEQERAFQSKAAESRDSAEWSGMNREAALMAAAVLSVGAASGAFSGGAAGAAEGGSAYGSLGDIAAGGGSAGSTAGYTGTAAELAADGLGGVDMGASAGSTAYYDAGAGMWVDSSTGAGISSGAEVPAGYTAESGSAAIAAGDAAPAAANSPSLFDSLQDYYKKGSNANSLAKALGAFTNSPQISGVSGFPSSQGGGVGTSGGVSSGGTQSTTLENPVTQIESSAQQQPFQSGPLGMIDVSPATNTFLQAGSTWNQQMANALRNRNAY